VPLITSSEAVISRRHEAKFPTHVQCRVL